MIDTKLIIVFGLSGVGKTTACAEYVSGREDVVHFSASTLLKRHRETANSRRANEVIQDQQQLIELVRTVRTETRAQLMLLDAHSLVVVDGLEIVIPVEVIAAMKPNGLIFFRAEGAIICQRRISRGDTRNLTPLEIERLQTKALSAAENFAERLLCRMVVINVNQGADLVEAIRNLS